jgi:hypothetical protein
MVTKMQPPIFRAYSNDIYHNARLKQFPRVNLSKITYCSRAIFRESGYEEVEGYEKKRVEYERGRMGEDVRADSLRRAKMRVFEYAMLNNFEYFITWTLDPQKIDRYNPKEVAEKMRAFLRNKVQRNNLRYIIVPELHKDGAVHAHGFVSGDLKMVNSGRRDRSGRTIYNMKQWKLGFSTAIRIDGDYQKACHYITKYVEKADKMIFGNFYYAGGHGLIRQPEKHLFDALFDGVEEKEYTVEAAKAAFKYEDI